MNASDLFQNAGAIAVLSMLLIGASQLKVYLKSML